MATKDHDDDEKKDTKEKKESKLTDAQEAEFFVKNPESSADFTKKREAKEAEAKKKADEAKAKKHEEKK